MRVCLVMTTFNAERWLEAAVRSALGQTHRSVELLVLDDGSTDRTLEILRDLARASCRVLTFPRPHRGRAQVLADAFEMAQDLAPDLMGYVDADDVLRPSAVAELVLAIAAAGASWGYTAARFMDKKSRPFGPWRWSCAPAEELLVERGVPIVGLRLMTPAIYESAGGIDTRYPVAMDYDLCLKLLDQGPPAVVEKPLYLYRRHGGQLTQTRRKEYQAWMDEALAAAKDRRR